MRSTLSTPFCNVMRRVSLPISGFACAAAFSVSQSLTANNTISTGPTCAGSSVTLASFRCRLPSVLSIVSPFLRIASRCAPRAMKCTSCPAVAMRAPKYPPTAPAAITAIRMKNPAACSGAGVLVWISRGVPASVDPAIQGERSTHVDVAGSVIVLPPGRVRCRAAPPLWCRYSRGYRDPSRLH